ncbi:hypothetical protein [Bradyrhizobium sp. B120]|uniref:hypothetical protein n=1 Tax=Bradyrhizobium sp. B120 TaxID=3410088 RepID=UPI003B981932
MKFIQATTAGNRQLVYLNGERISAIVKNTGKVGGKSRLYTSVDNETLHLEEGPHELLRKLGLDSL